MCMYRYVVAREKQGALRQSGACLKIGRSCREMCVACCRGEGIGEKHTVLPISLSGVESRIDNVCYCCIVVVSVN